MEEPAAQSSSRTEPGGGPGLAHTDHAPTPENSTLESPRSEALTSKRRGKLRKWQRVTKGEFSWYCGLRPILGGVSVTRPAIPEEGSCGGQVSPCVESVQHCWSGENAGSSHRGMALCSHQSVRKEAGGHCPPRTQGHAELLCSPCEVGCRSNSTPEGSSQGQSLAICGPH